MDPLPSSHPVSAPAPARFAARLAAAALAHAPYLALFIWFLLKQRLVLSLLGLASGPANLLASTGILLVLLPWVLLTRGRWMWLAAALVDALFTYMYFADLLYYRQFGDLISVATARFAGQLASVADALIPLLRWYDILIWVDVPLLLLLAAVPPAWLKRRIRPLVLRGRVVAVLALVGVSISALVAWADPALHAKYYGHGNVASRLGLLNFHAFDIAEYTGRLALRSVPSETAVGDVVSWFAEKRSHNEPSRLYGVAAGKNVIVLQVESLQAFPLGLKVNGQEVTPHMNRLAAESIQFLDFYTQTMQGVTSDADLLANCSLYPTRTGAVYYDFAANDFRCMPALLARHGYRAVAMQGMQPDFWNLGTVYPRVGFAEYFNLKNGIVLDEKLGIGLSDESFLRQAAGKLKTLPEPYYAFLVTLTSHGPFDFEGMPKRLDLGSLEGTIAGHYLHAVHYTDGAIGKFLAELKTEGILDNSVLMLYGDHAGVFRGNSGLAELLKIAPDDEVGTTRMEKRVPFLIRLPGGAEAGQRPHAAGQVDIAPTLAGLLGIRTDSAFFMGRDLLARPQGVVAFGSGSTMTDRHLYWNRADDPVCYERDPAPGPRVPVADCQEAADEAAEALRISRLIIQRNLIPGLTAHPRPALRP